MCLGFDFGRMEAMGLSGSAKRRDGALGKA
jgi:hypothetical protein